MADVEEWLTHARKVTQEASIGVDVTSIQECISAEPAQRVLVARRDAWRSICCAAFAALVAFAAINRVATIMLEKPAPTWVATPSAASPFGLLIGK